MSRRWWLTQKRIITCRPALSLPRGPGFGRRLRAHLDVEVKHLLVGHRPHLPARARPSPPRATRRSATKRILVPKPGPSPRILVPKRARPLASLSRRTARGSAQGRRQGARAHRSAHRQEVVVREAARVAVLRPAPRVSASRSAPRGPLAGRPRERAHEARTKRAQRPRKAGTTHARSPHEARTQRGARAPS